MKNRILLYDSSKCTSHNVIHHSLVRLRNMLKIETDKSDLRERYVSWNDLYSLFRLKKKISYVCYCVLFINMRKYTSRTHGSDYSINSKYHINNNVNSLIFYLSFERRSSICFPTLFYIRRRNNGTWCN